MAYRAPGAYSKEVVSPTFVSLTGGPRTPAILGYGSSSITMSNVEVTRGAGDTDDILSVEAVQVVSVTGIGDLPDYYEYVVDTDYTVSGKTISWAGAVSEPVTGATYYVTYEKTKPDSYYDPMVFYDIDDVRAAYGHELSSGAVRDITLGIKLALENGASRVVGVQPESGSQSDWQAAIDKLKKEDVDIIVAPGACSTTLQSYLRSHVLEMSSRLERKERLYFTSGLALCDDITLLKSRATTLSSERVTLVAPPSIEVTLHDGACDVDSSAIVSGNHAACAIAGKICNPNYDVAEPMTRKELTGIDNLSTFNYLDSEMNDLAASGICILVDDGGVIKVRHALTTDPTSANTAEISVVSIKDNVAQETRTQLDSRYVGKKITAATPSSIGLTLNALLDTFVKNTIIVAYQGIKATQDTTEPRTINVSFSISVVYPLNWIDITYSLYV